MKNILLALLFAAVAWAADTPTPPPLIYVPYDKVPGTDPKGSGVLLPYEEFRRLWEASQRPAEAIKPAMGAALTAFELSGAVEGERAVLRLSGTAVAFAPGWSTVDLPSALMVANLRGEDDRLVLERGKDRLLLHLPGPGTWKFSAEIAAPVARDAAGGRILELVLPSAGSGRLDLLLPEASAELAVLPALAVETKAEGVGTRVRAVVGGQGAVKLSWRAPVAAAAGTALILSDSRISVRIGERAVTTDLNLALTVLRRPISDLALRLPPGTQVLAVESPGLRTWEIVGDELRLHGQQPREGELPIHLRLERLLPAATGALRPLELVLPQVIGAERQTGVLAVGGDEGLAVSVTTHEGLSQVDPREAKAEGAAAAFRFLSPPPPLAITAQRLEADLRVQLHQLVRLAVDETRIDVIAELAVRRAGVFTLTAPLPAGWELVDASGLAIDDSRVTGEGATRKLELALRARLLGDGRLVLRFRAAAALPRQGAAPAIEAGLLILDGARMSRGSLAVAAPKSWALTASSAESLAGADARAVSADPLLADALRGLRDDEEVALAWSWLGQAHGPVLAAAPRSRELVAHQEELVTVAEGGVHRIITWRGEVRYSAALTLRLRLPSALAAQLQIKSAGLSERIVQAVPGAADQSTIELRFQTPLLGAFTITAELNEAMPRLEAGRPVTVSLAAIALDEATRRSVITAVARDGSLTIAASAAGLDNLATADLPPTLQAAGTVAAFRGSEAAALSLTVERHDLVALTDAAISSASYRAVLGDDRRLRVAATVAVNSRGRPHLELRLPEGADVLEVAVDGRITRPSRRSDGALVVPLGERAAFGAHLVAFAYDQPLGEGTLGDTAALRIDLPTVGSAAEGRTVPVEQTTLALWLPERLAAIAAGGDLRRQPGDMEIPPQRADGLTVAIPMVGRLITLGRLGDGGTIHLRLLSWRILCGLGLAIGLAVAGLGWLLRRRPRAASGVVAAALVVAVLAASATAWAPVALGAAIGAAVAALLAALSALRRWRAARPAATPPPASDPWQVDKP